MIFLYHESVEGFLFDLDGTVYLGSRPIEGAAKVITALKDMGKRVCFLTNNSNTLRTIHAQRLRGMGIPAEPEDVVTAAYATVKWLEANCRSCPVYVVGEEMLTMKLKDSGLVVTDAPEEASIVISSFDRTFNYDKLWKALTAMRNGARLIATNPDKACPVDGTFLPDCAAITAAIEGASERKAELYIGKPSPIIGRLACGAMGLEPGQCMMVGDSMFTDIGVGSATGMRTALVLTGVSREADIPMYGHAPDHVLKGIWELVG